MCDKIWVCLHTIFLWQVKHECFRNIKWTSFISSHTHIQGCNLVFYKYLTLCAKGMFNPLFEFLFCSITLSCHLRNKWILNIFLLDLRGKYGLYVFFSLNKKIFKISKLFVCWLIVALFYYLVWTSRSSQIMNGSINHFMWWFSSLNLICIESL